ncbi:MAG TPA: dihydrolipoyl dehydrogenase [Kofleriaceae bacterium]|nr:dihydrolipoyl dehydrogenase [Kofleriaceae bacterium]
MSHPTECDVLVIGSGPGGYVAAIRAAQLGLSAVCVERAPELGGICLNWGCIPTKALLRSAEVLELCHRAGEFGVTVEGLSFDFAAIIKRSRAIADKIGKGVGFLFRKNKVHHVPGTARLAGAGRIDIELTEGGSHSITAKHVIVATGARAKSLPGIEFDGERIIEYRKAMTLTERPAQMIVLGAGAIGVEFASFYADLGTEVTIVEYMPDLVPNEDHEIRAELARAFKKRGIKLLTGHKVTSGQVSGSSVAVSVEKRDSDAGPQVLTADVLLVAVGIAPNIEDLGLEQIGIGLTPRGFIAVNDDLETAVRGVHAIGDVIGRGLAHVAMSEGVFVAERIAGLSPQRVPYHATPACTYCHPEIASVGLTEEQARARGVEVKVGKFPFRPLGKTMAAGEYPGLVKFLWNAADGSLVGAHMIGPAVTDLIAVPTLAKTTEVNAESLVYTIHAHPTFAEALKEATEDALGHAIHL